MTDQPPTNKQPTPPPPQNMLIAESANVVAPFPRPVTREELQGDEDGKIAKLTADAIKTTGDRAARTVIASVEEIRTIIEEIESEGQQLAEEIRRHTDAYALKVARVIEDLRTLSLGMKDKRESLAKSQGRVIGAAE